MKLMKKDMGGAALVLALAHVVMSAQLPVKLRVLVPAVENAISGNAYRYAAAGMPTAVISSTT
jgi:leucyl aminopeptidase